MPKPRNYLDPDFPPEADKYGWDGPPETSWDVPVWMERTNALQLPEWMLTDNGSANIDYRAGMTFEPPDVYTFSLNDPTPPTSRPITPIKPEPCRYFLRNGRCKYASECYFSHEKPTDEGNSTIAEVVGKGGGRWIKEKELRKSTVQVQKEEEERRKNAKVCRFWKQGKCRYGGSCRDKHDEI
jgi:hypothetical protein